MKYIRFIAALSFAIINGITAAQPFASYTSNLLILDNGIINRVILLGAEQHGLLSKNYSLNRSKTDFLSKGSVDFYFEADDRPVTGLDNWKLVSVDMISDGNDGNGALVILEHPSLNLRISITYLMYPGLPVIRKKISFLNTGKQEIELEALDIENLLFEGSGTGTECWVMHDYARQKSLGQFIGNWYDPVVVVHEIRQRRGFVLGNEAPGVMKRTAVFQKSDQLTIGLTHPDQNFGFRKWLKPGEPWESTWAFTGIYENSDDPYEVLNGPVSDFVRRHMGTRLSKIPEKPVFVYNTWEPFFHNINENLIRELADAASECGIEEFVIDDGWQDSYGDWGINKQKFPNGLKPVFDYIKAKGMKPGVWISLGAAESKSKVYKEHPEWAVRKADGSPISLHADFDKMYEWETYSMCMTTGWSDYIRGVILNLAKEHGLEYIKGDFAVVTGAYTTDKSRSGCHAPDHPGHRDRNESMLEMYRSTWKLFDDLHKEVPGLFIDCTFETMGALQLIDLDMCKHAEGNWLSNFGEKAPLGSMRVRQMSWWRSPVIPATAMVIGNQHFDDPDFELSLMSLAGSLPIVLGDPRLLTREQRARMKNWADWLRTMQKQHDFMSFRQDLYGYGEPAEGNWDGYQRINSETHSGGIVGIFRQGSPENQRSVTVHFLDPSSFYEVRKAPSGESVLTATGKDLSEKGFSVTLSKNYDGAVFEITRKQLSETQLEEQGEAELAKLKSLYSGKAEWESRKSVLRDQILKGMDLFPLPVKTPLNPVINSIRIYDGYSVENVSFESIPGYYVVGNLYRPLDKTKKHPAVLCPHGHFQGDSLGAWGRFRPDQQKRCATFARLGAVVFSYSMFAWGGEAVWQLDTSAVIESPDASLIRKCHDVPLALTMQTWNSIRAIDFLESLPDVDRTKIAVTGASGGGTQSFLLAALDNRVSVSIPVVMVSAWYKDLCVCEGVRPQDNKKDQIFNMAEFAAMIAPKPMLIISDGDDWTKNTPEVEYPFIKRTYSFYKAENKVENVHFPDGKHNYGFEKRIPVYYFLAKHFGLNIKSITDSKGAVDESKSIIENAEAMLVFSARNPFPANALIGREAIEKELKSLQK